MLFIFYLYQDSRVRCGVYLISQVNIAPELNCFFFQRITAADNPGCWLINVLCWAAALIYRYLAIVFV